VHYTSATRTIGGTMIFSVFDSNVLVEMYRNYYGALEHKNTQKSKDDAIPTPNGTVSGPGAGSVTYSEINEHLVNAGVMEFAELADELPPIDIHIMALNETGHQMYMALFNVKFLDESMTISINDTFTEHIVQFVCSSITPLQTHTRNIKSRDKLFGTAFQEPNEEAAVEAELAGVPQSPTEDPALRDRPITSPNEPPPPSGVTQPSVGYVDSTDGSIIDITVTISEVESQANFDAFSDDRKEKVAAARMKYIETQPGYSTDTTLQ
ncbi:unnamed protein product, partial [marine sediment metagenome]